MYVPIIKRTVASSAVKLCIPFSKVRSQNSSRRTQNSEARRMFLYIVQSPICRNRRGQWLKSGIVLLVKLVCIRRSSASTCRRVASNSFLLLRHCSLYYRNMFIKTITNLRGKNQLLFFENIFIGFVHERLSVFQDSRMIPF